MTEPLYVTLAGDLAGRYVVEEQLDGGRIVLAPGYPSVPTTDYTDALDIQIEQEQQLITRFEARQAGAEGIVTTVLASAFTLAVIITTAARTIDKIDKIFALITVGALALVVLVAVCSRVVAGRRFSRSGQAKHFRALLLFPWVR